MDASGSKLLTGRWSVHAGAVAAFFLIAIACTWPLLPQAAVRIASDPVDPVLSASVLWWNSTVLPFTAAWWDPPFFYPAIGAAAFTEALAGLGVIATPIAWLTGNPILTYNLTLLLSWPLSAAAVYWLVWPLTRRVDAAFVAGLCFGFAPYRLAQIAHVQVLSAYWLPVALLALHKYLDGRKSGWLVLFGAAWALQALSNLEFALYGAFLILVWLVYFCSTARGRGAFVPIASTWILSSLVLVPTLLGYREMNARYGFTRPLDEGRGEATLYPGFAAAVLVAVACVFVRRARQASGGKSNRGPLLFYFSATLVAAFLVFAPSEWLMWLPGGLRVPVRFWMIGALSLSIAAGVAFARVIAVESRRRLLAVALVAAGVLIEGWPRTFRMAEAPSRESVLDKPDKPAISLEVPMGPAEDAAALFRAITNRRRRTFNGLSSYEPAHYALLREGIAARDAATFSSLTALGPVDVLVDQTRDPGGAFARLLGAMPGAVRTRDEGGKIVVRLPVQPDVVTGTRLVFASVQSEGGEATLPNLSDGRTETTWAVPIQQPNESITIDLGGVHHVIRVEHDVGGALAAYPRGLAIEVSVDGAKWQNIWQGSTRAAAMLGSMEDPIRTPMRFSFPPHAARYIRLRLVATLDVPWCVAELRVFGVS